MPRRLTQSEKNLKNLTDMYDLKAEEVATLEKDLRQEQQNSLRLASDLARRTDQFRALCKATNLILAIVSGEAIDLNR